MFYSNKGNSYNLYNTDPEPYAYPKKAIERWIAFSVIKLGRELHLNEYLFPKINQNGVISVGVPIDEFFSR